MITITIHTIEPLEVNQLMFLKVKQKINKILLNLRTISKWENLLELLKRKQHLPGDEITYAKDLYVITEINGSKITLKNTATEEELKKIYKPYELKPVQEVEQQQLILDNTQELKHKKQKQEKKLVRLNKKSGVDINEDESGITTRHKTKVIIPENVIESSPPKQLLKKLLRRLLNQKHLKLREYFIKRNFITSGIMKLNGRDIKMMRIHGS